MTCSFPLAVSLTRACIVGDAGGHYVTGCKSRVSISSNLQLGRVDSSNWTLGGGYWRLGAPIPEYEAKPEVGFN